MSGQSGTESPRDSEWAGSSVGQYWWFVRDGFWQIKDAFTGDHIATMPICDPWEWSDG